MTTNGHQLAHQALAQALLRLPGEVQPSRAMAQAVGDRLAPLVRQAIVADIGKPSMRNWPSKGEPEGRAIVLKGERAAEFGTARTGGVMIIRDRRGAGMVRLLDRGRNMGQAAGVAGPGVNRKTGITARTKSGNVRKVKAQAGKRWNGYTQPEYTWADALKLMRAAAPGAVHEFVGAQMADQVRKVVLGG